MKQVFTIEEVSKICEVLLSQGTHGMFTEGCLDGEQS